MGNRVGVCCRIIVRVSAICLCMVSPFLSKPTFGAGRLGQERPTLDHVQAAFGVRSAVLASIEARKSPDGLLEATFPINGRLVTVELRKHSVRASGYRVIAIDANGTSRFVGAARHRCSQ